MKFEDLFNRLGILTEGTPGVGKGNVELPPTDKPDYIPQTYIKTAPSPKVHLGNVVQTGAIHEVPAISNAEKSFNAIIRYLTDHREKHELVGLPIVKVLEKFSSAWEHFRSRREQFRRTRAKADLSPKPVYGKKTSDGGKIRKSELYVELEDAMLDAGEKFAIATIDCFTQIISTLKTSADVAEDSKVIKRLVDTKEFVSGAASDVGEETYHSMKALKEMLFAFKSKVVNVLIRSGSESEPLELTAGMRSQIKGTELEEAYRKAMAAFDQYRRSIDANSGVLRAQADKNAATAKNMISALDIEPSEKEDLIGTLNNLSNGEPRCKMLFRALNLKYIGSSKTMRPNLAPKKEFFPRKKTTPDEGEKGEYVPKNPVGTEFANRPRTLYGGT